MALDHIFQVVVGMEDMAAMGTVGQAAIHTGLQTGMISKWEAVVLLPKPMHQEVLTAVE